MKLITENTGDVNNERRPERRPDGCCQQAAPPARANPDAGGDGGDRPATRILLRDEHQPKEAGKLFDGVDPRDVLRQVLAADVSNYHYPILRVVEGNITFVDIDTHKWGTKPSPEELDAHAASVFPEPDVVWRTHGSGLRFGYCGPDHLDAALAATLSLDRAFEIEIKTDSRHPRGPHPRWPGAEAGPVVWHDPHRPERFDWRRVGRPSEADIRAVLEEIGMEPNGRYDHDKCLLDGGAVSDAKGCVVVLTNGIFCHRCAAKGITRARYTAGFIPFRALSVNEVFSTIVALAQRLVHWYQAALHLRQEHPQIGRQTLRRLYEKVVDAVHDERDPRRPMVFATDTRVLFTQHGAIDATTFELVKMTNDSIDALPAANRWRRGVGDEKDKLSVRRPLRDRVKNGQLLDGYQPVQLARGICFNPDPDAIPVTIPPERGEPICLLWGKELLPEAEVWSALDRTFPGLHRPYLMALLAARICCEYGGRPPILMAVGPTGAGKQTTVEVAASVVGDTLHKLALCDDEERWMRRVGAVVGGGHRFIMTDEILRRTAPEMKSLVKYTLVLGATITYRRLFTDGDITMPCRAVFLLTGGGVPDIFRKSPELRRRIWLVRLPASAPVDWATTCGGDAADWRSRSKQNAQTANSLLTYVYTMVAGYDFKFDRVAAQLELERPDEGEVGLQYDRLQALYRHGRGEDGKRRMATTGKWQGAGWIDARNPACWHILQDLLPDDDTAGGPDDVGSVDQLCKNLEMVDWRGVLGIQTPPIRLEHHRHHGQLVVRFRDSSHNAKSSFVVNEQLPPIPDNIPPDGPTDEPPDGPPDGPPNGPPGGLPTEGGAAASSAAICPSRATAPGQYQYGLDPSDPSHSVHPGGRNENACNSSNDKEIRTAEIHSVPSVHFSPIGLERNRREQVRGEGDREKGLTPQSGRIECREQANSLCPNELRRFPGWTDQRTERDGSDGRVAQSGYSEALGADRSPGVGAILAAAGFPTEQLVLDFETFFSLKFRLQRLTIPIYVHDPRFRIHGLAVRWPNGQTQFRTDVGQCLAELREAFGQHLERVTVVAHNWRFDGYILNMRLGCRPPHVVDTLDLARHVHPTKGGHTLRDLATAYGLTPKGDITDLAGVREPDPQQLAHLAAYARHDVELTSVVLSKLLPQVSRPEVELRIAAHTAKLFTERGVHIDREGAGRLLGVFDDGLQKKLAAAGINRKTAGGNEFVARLAAELAKEGRTVPMKQGKNGPIPAVAKTDQAMSDLVRDANPRVAALAQARLAVKSAPQFQKRLQTFVDISTATNGILPVLLNYCGAHTGRFSGGGGTNLQNLAKHLDGPSKQFRRLIRPAPGHCFAIADLAQIEARVLAWLAGQDDLVEAFREGRDVYSEFASDVAGETVRKPEADDPPEVATRLKALRQLGKQAILGLGYQMGANRFWEQIQKNPLLGQLIASGQLNQDIVAAIVHAYRDRYPCIPALWKTAEYAFRAAFNAGDYHMAPLAFERRGSDLLVTLPSGRRLTYLNVEPCSDGLSYDGEESIYGGKIVENLVQAIARDVLVDAILMLEDGGFRVVLHVHDELVVEAPADKVQPALDAAIAALRHVPEWAPGLPLDVDGHVANSYGDA